MKFLRSWILKLKLKTLPLTSKILNIMGVEALQI